MDSVLLTMKCFIWGEGHGGSKGTDIAFKVHKGQGIQSFIDLFCFKMPLELGSERYRNLEHYCNMFMATQIHQKGHFVCAKMDMPGFYDMNSFHYYLCLLFPLAVHLIKHV